tara:strand:- start:20 stop:232 length:213 start_codon:yes stop_codon:yes gene_type:complete
VANRTNVAVWFTAVKFFLRHYGLLFLAADFLHLVKKLTALNRNEQIKIKRTLLGFRQIYFAVLVRNDQIA